MLEWWKLRPSFRPLLSDGLGETPPMIPRLLVPIRLGEDARGDVLAKIANWRRKSKWMRGSRGVRG